MNKYEKILISDIRSNEVSLSRLVNNYNQLVELHTPKKPILIDRQPYFKKHYKGGYTCPVCHNKMYGASIYCHHCSQKIDWSE